MEDGSDTRQLIARILDGNTDEFEAIVEDHKALISHIVFRIVANPADQEDISQDVFVKVYQKLDSFHYDSKLSTWIARIAYNTCLNYLEKKKLPLYDDISSEGQTLDSVPADVIGPDDNAENNNVADVIQEEIMKLPSQYRTVLTLYHLDEMTYGEIAAVTNLPDGTVKSHLFRARKLLKDRLSAKYRQEDLCR